MNIGQKIQYWSLLGFAKVVGKLPSRFLYYPLADVVYFLLYRVVGYRRGVVRSNLRSAFPEKKETELLRIQKDFYRHLAEIFIDTLVIAGISRKKVLKKINFIDVHEHQCRLAGRNWIAATAHYGSWEYFMSYQLYTDSVTAGVYRPLRSKAVDEFYRYCRSRFGMQTVPMKVMLRYMVGHVRDGTKTLTLGMVADQSARPNDHTVWLPFLNHPTNFYSGVERLAVRFGMPVYYIETEKTGRGRYNVGFVEIYDGVEQLPEGEITRRYAEKLEDSIRRNPQYWMWSHKRWKYEKYAPKSMMKAPIGDMSEK